MLDGTQAHGLRGRTGRRLATTYHRSAGLQLVPETRHIFGSWSVEENLVLAGLSAKSGRPLACVWATFPRLRQRRRSRGTDLSGGEQQMLAIARAVGARTQNPLAR